MHAPRGNAMLTLLCCYVLVTFSVEYKEIVIAMSRDLCGNSFWTLTCWNCGVSCMNAFFGWGQIVGTVQLSRHSCTYLTLHLSSGQDAGESRSASLASLPNREGYRRSQEHISLAGPCYACHPVLSQPQKPATWALRQPNRWAACTFNCTCF